MDNLPSSAIREAFGLGGEIPSEPLPSGEGHSLRVGDAIFKPVHEPVEAEWCLQVMANLSANPHASFRIPTPLQAWNGKCVFKGWTASEYLSGAATPDGNWKQLLETSYAFHEALRHIPKTDFPGHRAQPWTLADRVAWGEASIDVDPDFRKVFDELLAIRQDVKVDCQVIHGYLTGNVLFEDGLPPAVIDFSPYWRPVEFANAIIVADGLLDFSQGKDLIQIVGTSFKSLQMLVRALISRLVAENELRSFRGNSGKEVERFGRALELVKAELSNVDVS